MQTAAIRPWEVEGRDGPRPQITNSVAACLQRSMAQIVGLEGDRERRLRPSDPAIMASLPRVGGDRSRQWSVGDPLRFDDRVQEPYASFMIVVSSCPVDADLPPVARHADATGAHVRHERLVEGRARPNRTADRSNASTQLRRRSASGARP